MVRVSGPGGARLVPIAKFHVPPSENVQKETILKLNEIVTEILLPPPARGLHSSYRKVRARRSWDFALASVALALQFDGDKIARARVVFGGAAPVPWRSKEVEEVITGRRLDAETVTRAAAAAVKNARPLKHNGYKISLFRGMIEEALTKMARV
jgi:xanthine dehydrogenase YagS FAD-binding subunit